MHSSAQTGFVSSRRMTLLSWSYSTLCTRLRHASAVERGGRGAQRGAERRAVGGQAEGVRERERRGRGERAEAPSHRPRADGASGRRASRPTKITAGLLVKEGRMGRVAQVAQMFWESNDRGTDRSLTAVLPTSGGPSLSARSAPPCVGRTDDRARMAIGISERSSRRGSPLTPIPRSGPVWLFQQSVFWHRQRIGFCTNTRLPFAAVRITM